MNQLISLPPIIFYNITEIIQEKKLIIITPKSCTKNILKTIMTKRKDMGQEKEGLLASGFRLTIPSDCRARYALAPHQDWLQSCLKLFLGQSCWDEQKTNEVLKYRGELLGPLSQGQGNGLQAGISLGRKFRQESNFRPEQGSSGNNLILGKNKEVGFRHEYDVGLGLK